MAIALGPGASRKTESKKAVSQLSRRSGREGPKSFVRVGGENDCSVRSDWRIGEKRIRVHPVNAVSGWGFLLWASPPVAAETCLVLVVTR
ncbi:hypothetical protein K440DRAFT_633748 [Wilcoxina mikolae CBS 423.85]|nr:hypothetical protein K440DRAFT_633748 [Wilcoxina mikolae CBS 423.85]